MKTPTYATISVLALAVFSSVALMAQTAGTSTISGVVRDPSGAAIPGVTVEASSPALIERSKSAVTDGQGAYRIIELRPGTYTVTFTGQGFTSYKQEGLELPAAFSATANAELKLGDVKETVTVEATAAVVDTQTVSQQNNFSRDVTQNLPTGFSVKSYATLIPGTSYNGGAGQQDVGGGKSEFQQGFTIHGGRADDFEQLRDGMFFGTMIAAGNWMSSLNPAIVSEVTVHTGGQTAEFAQGGPLINVVTRDGGNSFHGTVNGAWTNSDLQANNVDSSIQSRGVTTGPSIRRRYDIGGGVGGPIIKDKLWFFASNREWETSTTYPGVYYNLTPGTLFYTPDLNRPGYEDNTYREARVRLTYQATAKDKIAVMSGWEWNCNCPGTPTNTLQTPETYIGSKYRPNYQEEVTWTRTINSHLLLEAGGILVAGRLNLVRPSDAVTNHDLQYITNSATGISYGDVGYGLGLMGSLGFQSFGQYNGTGAITYVSGSHTIKTGGSYLKGWRDLSVYFPPGTDYTSYTFNGTTPSAVTYYAAPAQDHERETMVAYFLQDQWKIKRLTLNLGVRFDYLNGQVPADSMPAGPWVPARTFSAVSDVPNWKNWDPRLGAAYDLFGNGKTALRVFVGRFVEFEPIGNLIAQNSPVNLTATSATRSWTDLNGDYIPQANELGPLSNPNFGSVVQTTTYSNQVLHGNRPYHWQQSFQIEQQIWKGASLTVGYFRRSYGNLRAVQTLGVTPQDYTPYCVTVPLNKFLPAGGGNQICGLYDVNPASFSQVNRAVVLASNFGHASDVFNGVDAMVTARIRRGGFIQAGFATGSEATDDCYLNNLPNVATVTTTQLPLAATAAYTPRNPTYCHVSPPWSANTQFKAAIVYPLPWKLQASANYQNISPIPTPAQWAVPNSVAASSLGRNLAACGAQTTCTATQLIDVELPNQYWREPRVNQLDIRISRIFNLPRREWTIQPNVDLFNVTNSNSVESINSRIGAVYNNITGLLDPRVLRFGFNMNF